MPIARRLRGWAARLVRRSGPAPHPTRRNQAFDLVLALALGFLAVRYALSGPDGPLLIVNDGPGPPDNVTSGGPEPPDDAQIAGPGQTGPDADERIQGAIVAGVTSIALVFRRRFPLAVLCFILAITGVVVSDEPRLTFYAVVVAAYSAAAYSPYRVPTVAALVVTAVAATAAHDEALPIVPGEYVPLLILVPIVVAADGLRRWKLRVDESRRQVSELARSREEAVKRAAEEERERIARELHDVVTHNVSVMVIQAGAARTVMATTPADAAQALRAVEAGGRAALAELRQAMGLLSRDGDGTDPTAELTPQPGLDRVHSLVARVRDTGLPVELTVIGDVRPLPPGIELAAYRVVQEALTNAIKHAAGASATVSIDYGDDRLRVEVVDTGGTSDHPEPAGTGRGLTGLRARLAIYDGTLAAGRRLTGGYRVEAVIPVEGP